MSLRVRPASGASLHRASTGFGTPRLDQRREQGSFSRRPETGPLDGADVMCRNRAAAHVGARNRVGFAAVVSWQGAATIRNNHASPLKLACHVAGSHGSSTRIAPFRPTTQRWRATRPSAKPANALPSPSASRLMSLWFDDALANPALRGLAVERFGDGARPALSPPRRRTAVRRRASLRREHGCPVTGWSLGGDHPACSPLQLASDPEASRCWLGAFDARLLVRLVDPAGRHSNAIVAAAAMSAATRGSAPMSSITRSKRSTEPNPALQGTRMRSRPRGLRRGAAERRCEHVRAVESRKASPAPPEGSRTSRELDIGEPWYPTE